MGEGAGLLPEPLYKSINPFMRASPLWPQHLPKITPPKSLGVRISTCEFRKGHKHSDHSGVHYLNNNLSYKSQNREATFLKAFVVAIATQGPQWLTAAYLLCPSSSAELSRFHPIFTKLTLLLKELSDRADRYKNTPLSPQLFPMFVMLILFAFYPFTFPNHICPLKISWGHE